MIINFILLGKIMVDEKTLAEYNMDEKAGFIVVMITKVQFKTISFVTQVCTATVCCMVLLE